MLVLENSVDSAALKKRPASHEGEGATRRCCNACLARRGVACAGSAKTELIPGSPFAGSVSGPSFEGMTKGAEIVIAKMIRDLLEPAFCIL